MAINLSSLPLILLIFTFTTTPFRYITATSTTASAQSPDLNTVSRADNDDDGSSGVEKVWCVAKNNAADAALQSAIDWACGQGGANCEPIQTSKPCFDPNNIQSTASYVFNDYFVRNGRADGTCDFSGTAAISSLDPSHDKCKFPSSMIAMANGGFNGTATTPNDSSSASVVITGRIGVVLVFFSWFLLWRNQFVDYR